MIVTSLRQLNSAAFVLVQIGLFSLALMVSYEVLGRYVFHAPTAWAEEIGRLVLIWCICLGIGPIYAAGKMISMDFFSQMLGENLRLGAALILNIAILTLCFAVCLPGWRLAYQSYELGRRTSEMLHLPETLFQLSVPVGFGLLGLNAFFAALFVANRLISGKDIPEFGFTKVNTPPGQEE